MCGQSQQTTLTNKNNEKVVLLCCVIEHYGTYYKLHRHHQENKSPALPEESTVPLYVLIGSGFADLLPVLADNLWNLQVFVAVTYHAFGYYKFSTIIA